MLMRFDSSLRMSTSRGTPKTLDLCFSFCSAEDVKSSLRVSLAVWRDDWEAVRGLEDDERGGEEDDEEEDEE